MKKNNLKWKMVNHFNKKEKKIAKKYLVVEKGVG